MYSGNFESAGSDGRVEAKHMCMQMRGIEKQQSATTTSAFTGIFLSDHRTREEFMTLISHRYR